MFIIVYLILESNTGFNYSILFFYFIFYIIKIKYSWISISIWIKFIFMSNIKYWIWIWIYPSWIIMDLYLDRYYPSIIGYLPSLPIRNINTE